MNRKAAFTLIELLIVVAIIAILAAIAVPNFLEAQTRAKVTRSIANCRSLTTAIETYRVDHKGALPMGNYGVSDQPGVDYWWCYRRDYNIALSTPIAYMTSPPEDPFLRDWYNSPQLNPAEGSSPPRYYNKLYASYNLWDHIILHALLANPIGSVPGLWNSIVDVSHSASPGLLLYYVDPPFHLYNHDGAGYMFRGQGPLTRSQSYTIPYDPSNGTVSDGHVFYFN